jgi:DNA-directed RNA polymerase specialized sigma24 family protein
MRGFPTSASCAAIQRACPPAEAEALIAGYEGGGRVGELARICGIHRTAVSAHMSRAGKTRGQLTAAQAGKGGAAL